MPSKSVRFSRTQPQETNSPNERGAKVSKFRAHGENRFSLCSEIKRVLRFVIVDTMHSIPVIEEHRRSTAPVNQKSLKSTVQYRWKRLVFLLVQMNKIRSLAFIQMVSSLLETLRRSGLRKLLSREDKHHVLPLVLKGHLLAE